MEVALPQESPLDPLSLIKDENLARNTRALYKFLTDTEKAGEYFTYEDLSNHSKRSKSNISKYARNYWSWFLRKKEPSRGKIPARFACEGLVNYPEVYFVLAHQRNQVQFYRHFHEAMLHAKEVAEIKAREKRAVQQLEEEMQQPSLPLPEVPGQEFPEELQFADDLPAEEEEEEGIQSSEEVVDTEEENNAFHASAFSRDNEPVRQDHAYLAHPGGQEERALPEKQDTYLSRPDVEQNITSSIPSFEGDGEGSTPGPEPGSIRDEPGEKTDPGQDDGERPVPPVTITTTTWSSVQRLLFFLLPGIVVLIIVLVIVLIIYLFNKGRHS